MNPETDPLEPGDMIIGVSKTLPDFPGWEWVEGISLIISTERISVHALRSTGIVVWHLRSHISTAISLGLVTIDRRRNE